MGGDIPVPPSLYDLLGFPFARDSLNSLLMFTVLQDGLPLVDEGQTGAAVDLRRNYEEVMQVCVRCTVGVWRCVHCMLHAHVDANLSL